MVNKELNKERTNDKYNIVKYDYNGEILSLKSVEIKLDKKILRCQKPNRHTYTYNSTLYDKLPTGC